MTETCKHCGLRISGEPGKGWLHAEGPQRHKNRCAIEPYGYDAAPVDEQCSTMCRGVVVTAPDPGLTDLIAAHLTELITDAPAPNHEEDNYDAGYVAALADLRDSAAFKIVVEQHTNGRITEFEAHAEYMGRELPNVEARIAELQATIARVKALVQDDSGEWLPYWRATTSEIRAAGRGTAMSESNNPQTSATTEGSIMNATIDTALTAVYAAIERETKSCTDGSILTGLAELVVALNDLPVVPTLHDTGIVGYVDQASA